MISDVCALEKTLFLKQILSRTWLLTVENILRVFETHQMLGCELSGVVVMVMNSSHRLRISSVFNSNDVLFALLSFKI